ncbi:helix-turn-helix domain-containing protein [Streptomyces europaeiscabiei]|uniref:helix-turn-helix domain-containing protein n=1 Tax=Streptomyces europaeiscabiei TaxID=146819 RepID=UPI0029B846C3|nr:helix-turn-helix domain-containing protein [Streptomyces europaeiscabiei]MDX3695018.1 helix-turn-helix domain-containing protein [Streptomyces europaeiscabiei]
MTSPTPSPRAGRCVRRTGRRHRHLIALLTALKGRSGLSFTQLAARTAELEDTDAVSASTLKRAAAPCTVPQEHVVAAFVRACGAAFEDERDVLKVWRAARAEERGILAALRAPSVSGIRTRADFRAALVAAYERAGAPPLRVLQDRAGTDEAEGQLLLPLTTAWRITRREGQGPANWSQCEAFLRGCGIHPRRMGPWQDAWKRTRTLPRAELGPSAADVRRAARWTRRVYLNPAASPAGDGAGLTPLHSAEGPHARPGGRHGRHGEQQAAGAQAAARVFDRLAAADQHTVLAAGLTHLLGTQARRNGAAPDTGIDAIAVGDDGTLRVIESKRLTDPPPPGTRGVTPPARPRPPASPGRARRAREPQPA